MIPFLKYAVVERERRFLVESIPSGVSLTSQIVDRSITGTRLRLREVVRPDGTTTRKLGTKYGSPTGRARSQVIIMGANTYRTMADIVAGQDDSQSVRMAELPKVVFSSTIQPPLKWANTDLRREDAVAGVRQLKDSESGFIRTIGSLSLSRSLLAAGLVDRIRVMIFPLILGATGRERILNGLPDLDLQLVSSRTLDGRLQLLEYAPTVRSPEGPVGPDQKGS
ncbi:MAG: dihydrofolate reductase family protein [Actinomycetota bacterium]|nr:dihydrofolate reductase family protein [Actinomycetota bacterium]